MTPPAPADKETHKPSNFLRQIIEKDLAEGTYATRTWGGSPRRRSPPRRRPGRPGQGAHALSARAQRLPAHRPRQEHLAELSSLAREYGGVCHLRFDDTNPEKEEHRIRRFDPRRRGSGSATRPTWHRPPERTRRDAAARVLPGERLLRLHVPRGRIPDRRQATGLCRRAERPRRCAPTAAISASPAPTAPTAPARRQENLARFREMRDGQLRRRRRHPARQDRHGERPTSTCATRRIYRIRRAHAPQHRRQVVHLPDVHLRAPDRGRARADHPQHLHARVRGPAPVLRLAARPPRRGRSDRHARTRASTNSRAST